MATNGPPSGIVTGNWFYFETAAWEGGSGGYGYTDWDPRQQPVAARRLRSSDLRRYGVEGVRLFYSNRFAAIAYDYIHANRYHYTDSNAPQRPARQQPQKRFGQHARQPSR